MLLSNARVGDNVVDIRIADGVITEVTTEVGALGGGGVDAGGRWLVPGLWDNHVHFSQWSLGRQRLDLAAAASAREAALLVQQHLTSGSPVPFVGSGFRDGLWPDTPNLAVLDAASGSHPVVLVSGDLHSVWLNSAALAKYGHAGHPTGLLREDDAFGVTTTIAQVPDDELDSYALDASNAAAARGVVGIVDLEMSWNWGTWQRRQKHGNDSLRVEIGVYRQHFDRAVDMGLRTGTRGGDLLAVGPLKLVTDGSLNTRTAYCYDPYPGTDDRGMLTIPPAELMSLLELATGVGFAVAVHAIGDEANSLALDAFAATGARGTVEHAQLLAERDIPRFAALGVVASVQPEHAMDDRDVADHHWHGRTGRSFVLRSLLDAGATLALGSDAPVAPLDPWVSIAAAVGRARDGREAWHPEQAISFAEALDASTRSTVAVGQPADLVLLDADPYTATPDELRELPVAATLLAGRFTHTTL